MLNKPTNQSNRYIWPEKENTNLDASSGFASTVRCWLVVLNWFPVCHEFENSGKIVDQTKQSFPAITNQGNHQYKEAYAKLQQILIKKCYNEQI
jgi:hypothetical protein